MNGKYPPAKGTSPPFMELDGALPAAKGWNMFHPTAVTTQDGVPCTTAALTAQEDGALTDLIQERTKMMKNEKEVKKIEF